MKKIKLLMPILGITTLSSALVPLASCSNKDSTYKITFNESKTFTVSNIGIQDGACRWKITALEDYAVVEKNTTVTIDGKTYRDFWHTGSVLYIPAKDLKGDIQVTIDTVLTNVLDIDANGVLKGWKSVATIDDINRVCGNTLLIPAKVKSIVANAFYDSENNATKIPSGVTKLTFAEGSQLEGEYDTSVEPWTGTPAIGDNAFRKSPIEHIDFPITKGKTYSVGNNAFEGSKVKAFKVPHPKWVKYEGESGCWWEGIREERESIGYKQYVETRGLKSIGTDSFANCKQLKSIFINPFFNTMKEGAFRIEDNDNKSAISLIDLSATNFLTYSEESLAKQAITAQQITQSMDELNREVNWVENFKKIITQKMISFDNSIKPVLVLNGSLCEAVGPTSTIGGLPSTRDMSESIIKNGLGIEGWNAEPFQDKEKSFSRYHPNQHQYCYSMVEGVENVYEGAPNYGINNIDFASKEFNISLSKTELENKQIVNPSTSRTTQESTGTPMPYMDLNFEILSGNKYGIKFTQVQKSEVPQEADYLNNFYKISWETAPQAGETIELKVKIVSEYFGRESWVRTLKINFVA